MRWGWAERLGGGGLRGWVGAELLGGARRIGGTSDKYCCTPDCRRSCCLGCLPKQRPPARPASCCSQLQVRHGAGWVWTRLLLASPCNRSALCTEYCVCLFRRCGLALVDVEIPLVALADGVHSRSFSGASYFMSPATVAAPASATAAGRWAESHACMPACHSASHPPFPGPAPCSLCPAGCGVIVHQSDTLGLVLVDRNTVTVGPGDGGLW